MMNWAEYEDESKHPRPIILPLLIWLGIIGCVIFLLAGCATEPPKRGPRLEVCEVQVIGQSDTGLLVVAQACISPEEFAKSQQ